MIPSIRDLLDRGGRPALIGGDVPCTFEDLGSIATTWASALRDAGCARGDAVALLTDDALEMTAMTVASLDVGVALVPLDRAQPHARLQQLLRRVRARAILTTPAELDGLRETLDDLASRLLISSAPSEVAAEPSGLPPDAAYVFFTSGSTGAPNAVVGRRTSLEHFLAWEIGEFDVRESDRCSRFVRPVFDAALRDMLVPLAVGAPSCIPPCSPHDMEPVALAAWLDANAISLVHTTPTVLRRLTAGLGRGGLPSLRHMLLSGEPLLGIDVDHWIEAGGDAGQLVNFYGTTESTMIKLFHRVRPEDAERLRVPVGRPITGTEAYVVDTDLQPVATGFSGQIVLRTADLTGGYLDDADATATIFVRNPFSDDPADLLHVTGDVGRVLEHGDIEVFGRSDDQLKVNGVRIEPAEVEQSIRALADVRDCVVDAVEDETGRSLCAWVVVSTVPGGGTGARSEADLRSALAGSLPAELVPARFVLMEALPLGPSGKVAKHLLPSPPSFTSPAAATRDRARDDADDIERTVRAVFCGVLEVTDCGHDVDFFSLGGNSLRATRALARIFRDLHVKLPIRALFEHPTVAGLSAQVRASLANGPVGETPTPDTTDAPQQLSAFQRRVWFMEQVAPGDPGSLLTAVIRARGPLDLDALSTSLEAVVAAHDVLRLRVATVDGEPRVRITDDAHVEWCVEAVRVERHRGDVIRDATEASRRSAFSLERGPLVRARVVPLAANDHVLIITMHHIVGDEITIRRVSAELFENYDASAHGRRVPRTNDDGYLQYVRSEMVRSVSPERVHSLEHWRAVCARIDPLGLLDEGEAEDSHHEELDVVVQFPSEVVDRLTGLGRAERATPFLVFLVAVQVAISQMTGQRTVTVSTDIDRRDDAAFEDAFGPFVNTVVHCVHIDPDTSFRQVLRDGRDEWLAGATHWDFPYDELVRVARPRARGAKAALAEVSVNLYEASPIARQVDRLELELAATVGSAAAPLEIAFEDTGDAVSAQIRRQPRRVSAATMRRLADQVTSTFAVLARDPDEPVGKLGGFAGSRIEHH